MRKWSCFFASKRFPYLSASKGLYPSSELLRRLQSQRSWRSCRPPGLSPEVGRRRPPRRRACSSSRPGCSACRSFPGCTRSAGGPGRTSARRRWCRGSRSGSGTPRRSGRAPGRRAVRAGGRTPGPSRGSRSSSRRRSRAGGCFLPARSRSTSRSWASICRGRRPPSSTVRPRAPGRRTG